MKGLWGKEKKRKELRPLSIQSHNSCTGHVKADQEKTEIAGYIR